MLQGTHLFDAMGLGKTVTSIAAMCAMRALAIKQHLPFLVIAPKCIIVQWASEIQQHTTNGALKPLIFDKENVCRLFWMLLIGPNKSLQKDRIDSMQFDVLIMTRNQVFFPNLERNHVTSSARYSRK